MTLKIDLINGREVSPTRRRRGLDVVICGNGDNEHVDASMSVKSRVRPFVIAVGLAS
jgi:hypothetical protein